MSDEETKASGAGPRRPPPPPPTTELEVPGPGGASAALPPMSGAPEAPASTPPPATEAPPGPSPPPAAEVAAPRPARIAPPATEGPATPPPVPPPAEIAPPPLPPPATEGRAAVPPPSPPAAPQAPPAEEEHPLLKLGPRTRPAPPPPAPPRPADAPRRIPAPGSARAAMDDLEAKGLFLNRAPGSPPPAPRPSRVEANWDLFLAEEAPMGPLGAPTRAPEPSAWDTRQPKKDYTAGEQVYEGLAGSAAPLAETFTEFARRFERPEDQHRRQCDILFPPGVVSLFEDSDWTRLIDGFQRVLQQASDEASPWAGLAVCALAQDDTSTSIKLFDHALHLKKDLMPGRLLAELTRGKHDLWLKLAEGLAQAGWVEESLDLCNRVAGAVEAPDGVRQKAQKVRRKIRREHVLKKGEVDPEAPPPQPSRWLANLASAVVVVLLLAVAVVAGRWLMAAFQVDQGSNRLTMGLHLLLRLREKDEAVDRRRPPEAWLEEAAGKFDQAVDLQPSNLRAAYLRKQAFKALLEVGELRRGSTRAWDRTRWDQVRAGARKADQALSALKAPPPALEAERANFERLQDAALKGEVMNY